MKTVKATWIENVASALGVWAMKHEAHVQWRHDPEDRYGGYIICSRLGVEVRVCFDDEHETLEIHQHCSYKWGDDYISRPPLQDRERQSVTVAELPEALHAWLLDAYLIHAQWDKEGKRQKKEEAESNEAEMRERWAKNAADKVPGVHSGRVLENGGFSGIISCSSLSSGVKYGDTVWIVTQKPEVRESWERF